MYCRYVKQTFGTTKSVLWTEVNSIVSFIGSACRGSTVYMYLVVNLMRQERVCCRMRV